jgi:hypothetical protein
MDRNTGCHHPSLVKICPREAGKLFTQIAFVLRTHAHSLELGFNNLHVSMD